MSRDGFKGPKLPKNLLDQVGGAGVQRRRDVPRKDRRKAERQQKKATRSRPPPRDDGYGRASMLHKIASHEPERDDDDSYEEAPSPPRRQLGHARENEGPKSILKKPTSSSGKQPSPRHILTPTSPPSDEASIDEPSGRETDDSFTISRQAAKAGLSKEDDAVQALERKLGKRGGDDDGDLDWLLGGADSGSDDGDGRKGVKRKRAAPADEKWLRDKRRKAGSAVEQVEGDARNDLSEESSDDGTGFDGEDDIPNPFSEDELSEEDFDGFDEDGGDGDDSDDGGAESTLQPVRKVRENPYVAPASKDNQDTPIASAQPTIKYVPPSLRAKLGSSDPSDVALQQLNRRLQGQLNRLSEANMLSILQQVEQIYTTNPRQHVTSSLVDLLTARVSDPSRLEDAYLVLHAGFSAALYRVIGVAFGAQLLEKIVNIVDTAALDMTTERLAETAGVSDDHSTPATTKQQALNTMAFLAVLFNLQVVGANIVFDYIRQLLIDDLSETNAEILLRVLHFSGRQLRAEDPSALKDIHLLLQRKVAECGGEAKVPPRTNFLIREINDLKNNRQKATGGAPGGSSQSIVSEHLTAIRKTIGTLSSSRGGKAPEPLRPTLADLRDSAQKGKWWLPGASWHDPAKMNAATDKSFKTAVTNADDAGYESETPGHVNLSALARAQGMNTSVRRSIFITIMGSVDFRDAHLRLLKLHLKSKQMSEIARVLIHCVGAEERYNPYYALIAKKLCEDGRLKKAFRFGLWNVIGRLEEGVEEEETMSLKMTGNLAKFFAALMVEREEDGGLKLDCLKKMQFGLYMPPKVAVFAEALFVDLLLRLKKGKGDKHERIVALFRTAGPELRTPLYRFLEGVVAKGEMVIDPKQRKMVEIGCKSAIEGIAEAGREGVGEDDEAGSERDDEEVGEDAW